MLDAKDEKLLQLNPLDRIHDARWVCHGFFNAFKFGEPVTKCNLVCAVEFVSPISSLVTCTRIGDEMMNEHDVIVFADTGE